MGRSSRKRSNARQITLTPLPLLSSAGLRRSGRGVEMLGNQLPPASPRLLPTIKAEEERPILELGKASFPIHEAPTLSSQRSQNFAVVIITPPKEGSLSHLPLGRFPPPFQAVESSPQGKSKGKEISLRDPGISDSEDGDPVLSSVRKRKSGTRAVTINKAAQSDSDRDVVIESSPLPKKRMWVAIPSLEEDDNPTSKRLQQARDGKQPMHEQSEDSEDDDDPQIAPARRRRAVEKRRGKGVEDPLSYDLQEGEKEDLEKEDLEEDLAFMAPEHHILPSRTRYNGCSPKKTLYKRKLDELRAKRAGKDIQPSISDDDRPKHALYDTDLEDAGSHPTCDYSSDNESWIIEDDGALGNPDPDNQVPIEFTSLSHQSTRTNFKIVCLWIVQNILNPSFPHIDELSVFALRTLERRIDSYGGSVLQSSAWKAPFMRAMKARPCFISEPCDERQICDACNISGRTATYAVTITGGRYDPNTLEDLEGSDDDSEDSAGLEIPGEEKVFYLGRHCHARAQMSHAFIHWKKQLRDAIETILEQQGYFSPYWTSKAATMDVNERTRWANRVTDNLGDHIQKFYHDLKRSLEDAQANMTNQRSKRWR